MTTIIKFSFASFYSLGQIFQMSFENFNLTRWISHVTWLLLLIWPTACNYARAQTVTQPPANPNGLYTTLDPSMAIITLVLISTFFIIAMFSIYVRHCSDSRAEGVLPSRAFSGLSGNRGLDPSVIESFPIFVYSAVKDLKIGKSALECAVCLSEFEEDETLRLIPKCDHVFHPDCIDAWLASHMTCPVCRARLTPESNETVKVSVSNNELNQNQNNSSPELSEEQNGVVIDINDEQSNSDAQALEITNASHLTPMSNRPPKLGIPEKFPRSHSTGHSLVLAGVNIDRYTLRFPEEVRKQLMMSGKFKRTVSFNAVLARQGSSRKGGYRSGTGEGSSTSRGRYFVDRQGGRSDRWVFSMTPPFVSKMGTVKVSGEGLGEGSSSNGRNLLTAVKSPLNCLNAKIGQGGESSSARPQSPGLN